ncbi:MAG TPA: ATP-binding protein [Caulobacteraceae bacterium]|jgi:signal transduction histidine kinase/ActR/RegA family two-component response regulator|nr:ATP-binding protein [Caulobacteraceae bacterium]
MTRLPRPRLVWTKAASGRNLFVIVGLTIALIVSGIAMAAYNEQLQQAQRVRAVGVQADILASSVTAALSVGTPADAQEYVKALAANPDIEDVRVYDTANRLYASYSRPAHASGGHIEVTRRVAEKGQVFGHVYLRTEAEPLARRVARYSGVGLLALMGALLVAVLIAAQSSLARANRELEARAGELAGANESLLVEMAEREKAEEALRQSQKMEAIGKLTGGVAHDFNNLLMVASSGLDLMDRTTDPVRRGVLRDGIRQALERGASLTRQLLSFSRRAPLNPATVDLAQRIENMRVLLERSLREDIEVRLRLAPDLWPVRIDSSQLELALVNIAVNARDAMPHGGTIVVAAENHPAMDDGELKGDFVRLAITDSGEGIPDDLIPRVIEPFFTTKEVGRGTGLGLSQVYGFTRASGGDLRISSEPGKGTTIALYIPRSTEPVVEQPKPAPRGRAGGKAKGRILLVEDDETVAALVTAMVTELGYEPTRASTAAAALEALEKDKDKSLQVVFSDMVMPGAMNGLELAREIGRRRPDLPVVLTTGFSDAAAAATAEGMRLLVKPYRIEALAAELDAVREAKRLQRKGRKPH